MDINKFVEENKKIVSLFNGSEDYNPTVREIRYNGKIGSNKENEKELFELIQNPKYKSILWVAPTGSGKTYTADKLMQKMENNISGIFCPAKIQNLQNEKSYEMDSIVGGKALDDTDVNEKLRFSAVYDKADTVLDEIWRRSFKGVENPVIFVDEAHVLTESYIFRNGAITKVQELIEDVVDELDGTIVYITATPGQIKNTKFDLIINCVPTNYRPVAKKLTVLETGVKDNFHKTAFEQILKLIRAGKIPFVRLNSKSMIQALQQELATEDIVSESVTGDDKTYDYNATTDTITYHNNIYNEVVNNSQLPRFTRDGKKIQCYFATSVLECGTNVLGIDGKQSENLVPFFVIQDSKNASADAVEQFYNRVRYQVADCIMLIAGTSYNDLVNTAIDEITNLKDVKIKANDSNTYYEITTKDSAMYRKIFATCNKNNVFCIAKDAKEDTNKETNEKTIVYRADICKKSFIELEKVVIDQIAKHNANYRDLNQVFTGLANLLGIEEAKIKIDDILKQPTIAGATNSQGVIKRDGDHLVIDNNALWKYAHNQYTKQYFFLKDNFYSELQDRLGITNISIEKAESLGINMKEIKDKVKEQNLELIKKEIENNEDLMKEILEDKTIENLKNISKTDEYKTFIKFAKLNHDVNVSYNIIRDFNKSGCDKAYNELLKEKMKKLSTTEKNTIEKLTKMDELDYSVVKDEVSIEIIKIVAESGYWDLFVDGVKAGISVDLLIKQITKEDNTKENVKVYIQKTTVVKLLKAVDFNFAKLGNTINEKEVKIALETFYEEKANGEMKEKAIRNEDLVKLQNALNTGLKSISSIYYTKKHAKDLLLSVFNMRPEKKKDKEEKKAKSKDKKKEDKSVIFTLRTVAKSAL